MLVFKNKWLLEKILLATDLRRRMRFQYYRKLIKFKFVQKEDVKPEWNLHAQQKANKNAVGRSTLLQQLFADSKRPPLGNLIGNVENIVFPIFHKVFCSHVVYRD